MSRKTAVDRLLESGLGPDVPLRVLSASGQLGYGIPEQALAEGLTRQPHFIGCDMGSIDPGPYYLGSGKMATSATITRRDLRMVLHGARKLDVPLIIGTAGTSGAAPHLAATLEMIRAIAAEDGLTFRMAVIASDMPRDLVVEMVEKGGSRPLGRIPELNADTVRRADHLVGQLGVSALIEALEARPDIIVTGRACDTAVFAAIPFWLGYDKAAAMHMAKIIECTSICCTPGGRDAMLGTLQGSSFTLESMNPARAATPLSVAAHSLYEQSDPFTVYEPDGVLRLDHARYEAETNRIARVSGAVWEPAAQMTVKLEGAEFVGIRSVLGAATCDPSVIANIDTITEGVRTNVAGIIGPDFAQCQLIFHKYGAQGVTLFEGAALPEARPSEMFFLVECIAPNEELAKAVITVTKQYFLHHGFPGRLSTGGNLAFPFTPPELFSGPAYRFSIYHVLDVPEDAALFPLKLEEIGAPS